MTTLPKTRSVALAVSVSIAGAAISVGAMHAQAVPKQIQTRTQLQPGAQTQGQTQTSATTTTPSAGQTAGAADTAGQNLMPDLRRPMAPRPGALTLSQVMNVAKAKSPMILASELKLRAVQAQEIQAGARANPYLSIYGSDLTRSDTGNASSFYSVQVSRLFERGDKRRWRLEIARATTSETQAEIQDAIRNGELTMKTAFTHMLIAQEALELSKARLKYFGRVVDSAQDRYKSGTLSKLDYERLDLQLSDFEADEADDIVNLRQASDQLQTMMGIETPAPDFVIAGEIVPPNVASTQAELVQSALAHRPDYAEVRFAAAAATANARLAAAYGTTDPTLETEYDHNGTVSSAGASINIPLRIFNRNQGNKETARFEASASRLTETAARNQVISDVDAAWVGYVQAKRLSERFGNHYLDESQDILLTARRGFDQGSISLMDYLDALRDNRLATANALNAYQQTWLAIYKLNAASATELVP